MATKTTVNISPKVLAGLLTGLGTAAVLGIAKAVNADTFDFLGPWSVVAYPAFTVLVGQVAAWLKREHDSVSADTSASSVPLAPELAPAVSAPTVEPLVPQTAEQLIASIASRHSSADTAFRARKLMPSVPNLAALDDCGALA